LSTHRRTFNGFLKLILTVVGTVRKKIPFLRIKESSRRGEDAIYEYNT
jgi:hypothetical protein